MIEKENIFQLKDYRGEDIIFTVKKWNEKKSDHPELNKPSFLSCVERAVKNPDEVWQDYGDFEQKIKTKRCYYKKYSAYSYAKVVVWIKDKPCLVVTAFEIDRIKEENYRGLKRYV